MLHVRTTSPLALAKRAQAAAHRAIADALDAEAMAHETADERMPIEDVAAELGISARVILDDERRQRCTLERAGRRRFMRTSERDRWLASRAPTKLSATASNDTKTDDEAARDRMVARLARAK
jgi:hypothetical protein